MTILDINIAVVITAAAVFTLVTGLLILMLQVAAKRLVKQGNVHILVNDEKDIEVSAGGTLLNALSNNGLFLPSACGGGGTCAMCKCQVFEGGGEILPTETGHIKRRDQKEKWRLACQVKVKVMRSRR